MTTNHRFNKSHILKGAAWIAVLLVGWGILIYHRSSSRQVQALPDPQAKRNRATSSKASPYAAPLILGTLKNRSIVESSGLTASRTTPGIYWTHNDSGDGPFIFAFDAAGTARGVWQVPGSAARDWEDIAAGPGPQSGTSYLYIGDIGDNKEIRPDIVVYRVAEPTVTAADASSTKANPQTAQPAEVIRLRYPDGKHNAETLMVHPQTANLYIVTKVRSDEPGVYEAQAPLSADTTTTMKRIATLNIQSVLGGLVTGGSISPDGTRVSLCDYFQGYELVLPQNSSSFDVIWSQPLTIVPLGQRQQGEAITYSLDGKALLATSEGRFSPIIQVVRR
jgi:hypothetical protein